MLCQDETKKEGSWKLKLPDPNRSRDYRNGGTLRDYQIEGEWVIYGDLFVLINQSQYSFILYVFDYQIEGTSFLNRLFTDIFVYLFKLIHWFLYSFVSYDFNYQSNF